MDRSYGRAWGYLARYTAPRHRRVTAERAQLRVSYFRAWPSVPCEDWGTQDYIYWGVADEAVSIRGPAAPFRQEDHRRRLSVPSWSLSEGK